VIRRIRVDDVEVYRDIRLHALADSPSAFGSTYAAEADRPLEAWVERVNRCATSDGTAVFLAYDGDTCIGLAGCYDADDLAADFQLISMWVAKEHRGTRVATDLVDAVIDWTTQRGARTVGLWVTRGNDRARRFYERMGFVLTGDTQPLPSDPSKDELRMLRRL